MNMDNTDWRGALPIESRERIVNKIMDTLKRLLPVSGQDGLHELRKIAQRFEEKIFTAATSQPDYLRKISLKMLTMETKPQGVAIPPNQATEANMDNTDWRGALQHESRQRIVNKITDTLKRHLPVSSQDGLHELGKIAQRFEEKIFSAATSQPDYLRKISLKMLTLETKTQGGAIPPNEGDPSKGEEPPLSRL